MSRQVGRRSVLARRFANTLVTGAAADGLVTHVALSIDDGVRFGLADAPQATDRFGSLVGMTAAWLDVIEVRLLTGRRLTDADDPTAAMLSARAAEMIAPEASPLGMVLRVAHGSGAAREVRVVGVVAGNLLRPTVARPDPVIYVPLPKQLSGEFTLRVRAADPEALRADLLTLVNRIDSRITWTSIRRGDMRFQDEAREMAGAVYVVGAAGTVALALSATGLYAVLSYIVALRRREIGVCLADRRSALSYHHSGDPPGADARAGGHGRAGWPWLCRWRSRCARPSSPKSPPPIRWSSCQ